MTQVMNKVKVTQVVSHFCEDTDGCYGGTSLIRTPPPVGPYDRTIPKVLWWSYGGGCFL